MLIVCVSVCVSFYPSVYLPVFIYVNLSVYLSICLSVCLLVCTSVCLFVYLTEVSSGAVVMSLNWRLSGRWIKSLPVAPLGMSSGVSVCLSVLRGVVVRMLNLR